MPISIIDSHRSSILLLTLVAGVCYGAGPGTVPAAIDHTSTNKAPDIRTITIPDGVSPLCNVAMLVRASGVIQVAQVIKSSGSSVVDYQCAWDAVKGTMEPAKLYGNAVDKLISIPMQWTKSPAAKSLTVTHDVQDLPVPALADQPFHLDPPYYPELALKLKKEGICAMRIAISDSGEIDQIDLIRTTGFRDLDIGCIDAMYSASFTPARNGDRNVAAMTTVFVSWLLSP